MATEEPAAPEEAKMFSIEQKTGLPPQASKLQVQPTDEQIDKALAAFYPGSKGPWPWAARHAMEAALEAARANAGNQMLIDEAIWDKGFASGIEAAANRHQEGAQAAETWQDTNEAIRALRPDAAPAESEEAMFSIEQKKGLPP